MSTIAVEIQRAKSLNGAKESSFKGVTPRSTELNNLKDGDVVTIPADYVALEQPIRGAKQRKDPNTGKMVTPSAKYIFVNVNRNGKDMAVAFYPTSFWKRRRLAEQIPDPDDDTKMIWVNSDEYVNASGEVAEHVQGFADLDEALKDIAGKPFHVKKDAIKVLPYETEQADDAQDDNICEFTWAA